MICSPSELRLILGYFFFSDSCFSCERFEPTRILCSFLLWLLTYIVDLPAQSWPDLLWTWERWSKVIQKDVKAVVSSVLICTFVIVMVHGVMLQTPEGACPIAYNRFDLAIITFWQFFVLEFWKLDWYKIPINRTHLKLCVVLFLIEVPLCDYWTIKQMFLIISQVLEVYK